MSFRSPPTSKTGATSVTACLKAQWCVQNLVKLSVVRRISNKAASFIMFVLARLLLNTMKLLWVSAYSFIADDMTKMFTDVFPNPHLLGFNFKLACPRRSSAVSRRPNISM